MSQKKLLLLSATEIGEFPLFLEVKKQLADEEGVEVSSGMLSVSATKKDLQEVIEGFDRVYLATELREVAGGFVTSRSVNSHFLGYSDFLTFDGARWWSDAVFSDAFTEILTEILQSQNYRGAVLFLGMHDNVLPLVQVLSRFGCRDICFLQTGAASGRSLESLQKATQGIFDIRLTTVDSSAFIQSQKEYSLCLVAENNYSQEVIEDMSYFHFLSSRSMIFDLVGKSNFQFEDVKALGVGLVAFETLAQGEIQWILKRIRGSLKDL